MKHLFSSWGKVKKKLASSRHVLLAFDYDGTLTPIVKTPELARLSSPIKNLLKVLSENRQFTLAIISGRPLAEIKKIVGLKKIIYAGNHGLEVEGPKIKFVNPRALKSKVLMRNLFNLLSEKLSSISGALVENKVLTLSIHFRLIKSKKAVGKLRKIFYSIIKPWQIKKKIKVTFGKKVYEIRPPLRWDKGKSLKFLLEKKFQLELQPLVISLGDDRTDEDMFKAVKNKGISIFVGNPRGSSARYYLRNVGEVKNFLERLNNHG